MRNLVTLCVLGVTVVGAFILDNPEWAGRWEAQKDIAYDSVMSEHYVDIDCDCADILQ